MTELLPTLGYPINPTLYGKEGGEKGGRWMEGREEGREEGRDRGREGEGGGEGERKRGREGGREGAGRELSQHSLPPSSSLSTLSSFCLHPSNIPPSLPKRYCIV